MNYLNQFQRFASPTPSITFIYLTFCSGWMICPPPQMCDVTLWIALSVVVRCNMYLLNALMNLMLNNSKCLKSDFRHLITVQYLNRISECVWNLNFLFEFQTLLSEIPTFVWILDIRILDTYCTVERQNPNVILAHQ